jgi:FKBP-type peptidyl-prolyl cis-trans isomerase FkpA
MKRLLPLLLTLLAAACAGTKEAPPPAEYHAAPANGFEEAFSREEGVRPIKFAGWLKTLRPGTGASPTSDSVVKVHYRGTLTDGKEFDSSYARDTPAQFSLRQVVPCWTFGVPAMKTGEKAKFVCPSSAAYGDAGSPPHVPPKATLVFEIELLDIVK